MTKIRRSDNDWIAKNQNEKPQTFSNFKKKCRNWDINQVIILEMWDEDSQVPPRAASDIPSDEIY